MPHMKYSHFFILPLLFCFLNNVSAQESSDYLEFNDRKNVVHGVYLGFGAHYGSIAKKFADNTQTQSYSFKVAYVANRKLEVGFVTVGFFSFPKEIKTRAEYGDNSVSVTGLYGGLHLEPIFFSKSKINVSLPILIGGGGMSLRQGIRGADNREKHEWKMLPVVEPGLNVLYNVNKYVQFEAGIKYRFSGKVNFKPAYNLTRINGFSAGAGIKVGVFNMGKNRYKKKNKKDPVENNPVNNSRI